MTDEAKPGTDKVRSKTMHPALREASRLTEVTPGELRGDVL